MNTSQEKIYQYFERDPELRVLFVFNDPFLKLELDEKTWAPGYRYVEFQGDWFTTKYNLDNDWADDKVILYVNQVSPLRDKKLQERFPLMDVLTANMEFRHQDYAAFMQQYGLPKRMATFVEKNIMQLQSDKMLKLLLPYYQDGSITEDVATRAFIASFWGVQRVLEWDDIIVRVLIQGRESERQKQTDFFFKLEGSRMVKAALSDRLHKIFGVSFDVNDGAKISKLVQVMKYNAITQNLAVVDADNYKNNKISDALSLQQMNRILELAMSQPKTAEALMEIFKELGSEIHDEDIIRWYGTEANYYFVPDALCVPILSTLMEKYIADEPERVRARIEDLMIKHGDNGELSIVMDYDIIVARFYQTALSLGSLTLNTPDEYVIRYQSDFYQIDQLYRLATEAYYKISPSLSLYGAVQTVKQTLDFNYAKLANRINLEWTRCVKDAGGMTALHQPKQQDFYEREIKPIQKKVAVIVSDALRYEVAHQLIGELAKSKHVARLNSAIAMLPTETKFCKPSLFPHRSLTLYGDSTEQNMSVDNKILSDINKRTEHLQNYKEDAICVAFDTIAEYNLDKNREIFKHPLVYIFHNDIDDKSHDASAKDVVKACADAVADLATMIPKIHASYNVTEVYVTSDHGFLFNDMVFEEKDKHKVTEDCLEKKSRYYLTRSADAVSGIVKYPLGEVSGMDNVNDVFVAVPEGTNRLAAAGGYVFAHGGASLQEMIIPVIISRQERADNKQPVGVMVLDRKLSITASRLRFKLLQTEAISMDMKERVVTVALYHNDKPVTALKQICLDKTDALLDNRKIVVDLTLNKNVDAKVLQLKVYDVEDDMNPLIKENVTNNTLIANDFD